MRSFRPDEVRDLLSRHPNARILDVRTREEWAAARIEGAVLLTAERAPEILAEWDREAPLVVYCHHGVRSLAVGSRLVNAGFADIVNLDGGIDAWSTEVDPSVPRYRVLPGGVVVAE